MYEKNSRIIWTDYTTNIKIAKELNITRVLYKIQEYRRYSLQQRVLYRTPEDNKKLQTNMQKKPAETNNKTSKSVRQVWANRVLAR